MHSIYQRAMIQAQFPSMCTLFVAHYKTCSKAIASTSRMHMCCQIYLAKGPLQNKSGNPDFLMVCCRVLETWRRVGDALTPHGKPNLSHPPSAPHWRLAQWLPFNRKLSQSKAISNPLFGTKNCLGIKHFQSQGTNPMQAFGNYLFCLKCMLLQQQCTKRVEGHVQVLCTIAFQVHDSSSLGHVCCVFYVGKGAPKQIREFRLFHVSFATSLNCEVWGRMGED